jgi:hypothetical protein
MLDLVLGLFDLPRDATDLVYLLGIFKHVLNHEIKVIINEE